MPQTCSASNSRQKSSIVSWWSKWNICSWRARCFALKIKTELTESEYLTNIHQWDTAGLWINVYVALCLSFCVSVSVCLSLNKQLFANIFAVLKVIVQHIRAKPVKATDWMNPKQQTQTKPKSCLFTKLVGTQLVGKNQAMVQNRRANSLVQKQAKDYTREITRAKTARTSTLRQRRDTRQTFKIKQEVQLTKLPADRLTNLTCPVKTQNLVFALSLALSLSPTNLLY